MIPRVEKDTGTSHGGGGVRVGFVAGPGNGAEMKLRKKETVPNESG